MEEIFMLRPKEVVCKWVDAFNNHDVEAIVSLYHDNATNHQVTNDPVIGIDAIREMFTTEFATADMTAIVENIFEDGQWAILEWKDPLGLRGCGFFHVVNGKILEQRRSSVAGLTEYPTDSVHEEWQVGDTVQLRTEPFEL